ncbi:MAG: 30S ribosomal protein S17 [Patescibacteria group bacterium]
MPKKIFIGQIVSDKMEKTVVVSVEVPKLHPRYGKSIKNTVRFKARNEIDAKLGDIVTIEETRPFSKTVTWIVKDIVESLEEEGSK